MLTLYVCECGYQSLTPGRCRSHPLPARAMGPDLTPVLYERTGVYGPTKAEVFFQAICGGCEEAPDLDGYEYRVTAGEAIEAAKEEGWVQLEDASLRCPECRGTV